MTMTVKFRLMKVEDIDQVVEIEKQAFATPWSKEAFYNELTANQFSTYLVMEIDEQIIGYCGTWIVIDEAHITNIAILPKYRGKGLGYALLKAAMNVVKKLGALSMTLEVRTSNHIAQSLYKKLGFEAGGIRKNYYSDNNEDALVMWVKL
ncbi:ribosomal protein S18-alanine N-acetyltransferase [Priestia flexa]|jgi:[ribosomal protein S18]-alanine N-acetyltransferase|uniref:[Ribosomal protein bS18]-alanine N-acetyltransferase n=1 Tax=Priestia flexa TaxID=86664 RepID=A0A8I1SQQ0_9BACI|nr:ribosomal protein S18-alanine N-acetyltransferase [Priestia flexa]MBN8253953.1 ribosomal protein S18-alanine N-acetyltransferase [Priestia flexa]MBN8436395.1 ribosomal protein S18-alanine N-acetyltransferase [Priestia flexa]MCA0968903.1 ribosomal protein S18-alanine N-acetyltransferase [Priestia flexa]RIV05859.1 ribosomal-protein-alanine N-acetyltransferase [Priestia flexa]